MYQNITKKHLNPPLYVKLIVVLRNPYNQSLDTLINMVNMWGMMLIHSQNNSNIAIIKITTDSFKKLFAKNPENNKIYTLKGTEKFILYFVVSHIDKKEEKDEESTEKED